MENNLDAWKLHTQIVFVSRQFFPLSLDSIRGRPGDSRRSNIAWSTQALWRKRSKWGFVKPTYTNGILICIQQNGAISTNESIWSKCSVPDSLWLGRDDLFSHMCNTGSRLTVIIRDVDVLFLLLCLPFYFFSAPNEFNWAVKDAYESFVLRRFAIIQ